MVHLVACDNPFIVEKKGRPDGIPVPCGKCPPCKKRRIDSWVFRLEQQDKISISSYFVTLTYDKYNVPITPNKLMTLSKRDHQLFFKRLRKVNDPKYKIKYYIAGEYGTQTWRPHYHAIIFNVLDYEQFDLCWNNGTVHVDKVNSNTIAYTAKYIDKPKMIPRFERDDRLQEYSAMSNGLGLTYLQPDVYNWHVDDIMRLRVRKNDGRMIPMPKYFRDKIYTDSEKAEQRKRIVESIETQEQIQRKRFKRLYGENPKLTYEQWCESKKLGRHNNYQKQVNKNRDYA